jgi:hypothetical protein
MSCEKNQNKVSQTAGIRAGISQAGSRVGNAVGAMAGRAGQVASAAADRTTQAADTVSEAVGRRVAPVSNKVLGAVNRPTTIAANLAPALIMTASVAQARVYTTGPGQGARPGVAVAIGMKDFRTVARNLNTFKKVSGQVKKAQVAVGLAAGLAAAVTASPGSEEKTLVQVKKRGKPVEVHFSQTRLTGLLNRGDRLVSGRNVVSSEGSLVQTGRGNLWHQGTTVMKTAQGERTVTHLRSLALPPTSHYFDRSLSEAETAEIVSGQGQAHKLPGYVGTVGGMEQLSPAWAQAKRAMILTRLHWPGAATTPEQRWAVKEEEAAG